MVGLGAVGLGSWLVVLPFAVCLRCCGDPRSPRHVLTLLSSHLSAQINDISLEVRDEQLAGLGRRSNSVAGGKPSHPSAHPPSPGFFFLS